MLDIPCEKIFHPKKVGQSSP